MINALTGCCVFCGSPQIISAKDDLSQRDADLRATAQCHCSGAIHARMIVAVHEVLAGVLDDGLLNDETVTAIEQVAQCVIKGLVESTTVYLIDGSRLIMRLGKRGFEAKRIISQQRARDESTTAAAKGTINIARALDPMIPMRAADMADKGAKTNEDDAAACYTAAYQRYAADRRAEYDRRLESKRLNWDCDTYTPTHERARVRLQHARGKHK